MDFTADCLDGIRSEFLQDPAAGLQASADDAGAETAGVVAKGFGEAKLPSPAGAAGREFPDGEAAVVLVPGGLLAGDATLAGVAAPLGAAPPPDLLGGHGSEIAQQLAGIAQQLAGTPLTSPGLHWGEDGGGSWAST